MSRTDRSLSACLFAIAALSFLSIGCGGGSSVGSASTSGGGSATPTPSMLEVVSSPPTQASEGSAYTYVLQANVQGAAFVLTSAPSGAVLTGNQITWSPTSEESRTTDQFAITATYEALSTTQGWSVTPAGTIRGTTAMTCISDSGQIKTTFPEAGDTVQVLVPNSAGGFDTFTSAIAQDGTFSFPNVPSGSYWLKTIWINLWTSGSAINLGRRGWGSCSNETVSSAGTSLQVSITGLNPWQYSDYFSFAVPNERSIAPPTLPQFGGTSVTETIPSSNLVLFNSANGDNAYTAQLVNATYAGIQFQSLERFSGPTPVTVQNGLVNSMAVELQSAPQTNSVRAKVQGSAFAALYPNESRSAAPVSSPGDNFRVDITPDNIAPSSNGLFLVLASHAFSTDTDAGDIPFANPYPSWWTAFVNYYDSAHAKSHPAGRDLFTRNACLERSHHSPVPHCLHSDRTPPWAGAKPADQWRQPVSGSGDFRRDPYTFLATPGTRHCKHL